MTDPSAITGKARRADRSQSAERQSRGNIFVVEDEQDLQELLHFNLEREGYTVSSFIRGEQALEAARAQLPDLITLDLMLPGIDGLEICRELRSDPQTASVPIVMLTAKGEEADIVAGLELGADDYITKPFSPRVLIARIKAVLRRGARQNVSQQAVMRMGELMVDTDRYEATVNGKAIELTNTEFKMLHLLISRPGRVFTRGQIVQNVQGENVVVTERSVDVHMVALRRKLDTVGHYIKTVRGVGYRMEDS